MKVEIDVAEMYDLSAGGDIVVVAKGALEYAKPNSTDLAGAIPYFSNTLSMTIDGAAATTARAKSDFYTLAEKRSRVTSCSGSRLTATANAIRNCRSLAQSAQSAASGGSSAKMLEFFKSSSSSVRSTVAKVFANVASECSSTTSGYATYYCADIYGACSIGVLAYTLPSASIMVNCPLYFNELPPQTQTCHGQDQATTTLHEMTHLRQIKGTDDFGAYGHTAVRRLSATQNLNHADTYTLFAQSIYAGC